MHWTFQPVGGPLFTAGVMLALVLALLVLPRPRPSRGKLVTLLALRGVALLLMLLAMLRPTLVYTKAETVEASLLLLVDSSRSMSVEDSLGSDSRWEVARRVLGDSRDSLRGLADKFSVQAYRLDSELKAAKFDDGEIQLPEEATGESTALGAAIEEAIEREGDGRLLGMVLLSDGAQRALAPNDLAPQLAVRRLASEGVPLYTATFGKPGSGDRADVAVEDLLASDTVYVKAPAEVTGVVRVAGYPNQTLLVQLMWEDAEGEMQVVDAQQIDTRRAAAVYPFRLEHTPLEAGERKLEVRVEPQEGELITTNNSQTTFVSLLEGGVKVLQMVGAKRVGGAPGIEQRFVRAALEASPDIVVARKVFNYRGGRTEWRNFWPTGAEAPDVVLMDDVDELALSRDAWRNLSQEVRTGTGLAMTGGLHSFGPGGYANSPLAGVLPINMGRAERQPFGEPMRRNLHLEGPLQFVPAKPLGVGHPILQVGDANLWRELPELPGANRLERSRLKANARVLAVTADASEHPLLVVGEAGRGRVAALAVDATWRWRLAGQGEAHRRFWRQIVLWLAQRDDDRQPVYIELAARRVARGGRLDLTVGARGVEDDAEAIRYEVIVENPAGEKQTLPTAPGVEAATAVTDTTVPGVYTVRVEAFRGDQSSETEPLGEAAARFSVPEQDLELDRPGAEPTLMAQLAATTTAAGGRAIAPEELPSLLEDLAAAPPEIEEEVTARVTPWDTWPFFLAMVGLLGTEWFLRKKWGLV